MRDFRIGDVCDLFLLEQLKTGQMYPQKDQIGITLPGALREHGKRARKRTLTLAWV